MRTDIVVRQARAEEAEEISALALRSKSHWGYDEEFLRACRDELTVTPEMCTSGTVRVAVQDTRILGYHRLAGSPAHGELSALFVDLEVIGHGIGGVLLEDALALATARGFRSLVLDADPGAELFYRRFGAVRLGESPSGSIPGRTLPRLRFDLTTGTTPSQRRAEDG
ncbi:GNAT family N-acetyltransferase [Brachybacterium sacelli]|uniref:GNAT superfamily N-acetyltransferase n=1 Tax=Brachybacterium sacelli TaxID=173364 RepID=A0ABS4X4F1_9MICO|nr:GNAT family N-acetyltransferase [Brachybacterium sacelli]MBP2383337.1 GNAT superfamily N-acetyltransferase [Brachybacterium sacelli]